MDNVNFSEVTEEELYEIDGGSFKAVSLGAAAVAGIAAAGAAVARRTGHDNFAGWCDGVAGGAACVSLVCAVIPMV